MSTRRAFLATAGVAASLPLPAAGYSFFTKEEVKAMEALCERIFPADETPGAKQAGAVNYIDKQMVGPLAKFAPAYRQGLASLGKVRFVELGAAEQDALLEQALAGRLEALPASFVRMAIDHTMQGVFSDPKHGGNRNQTGWKLIGFSDDGGGHKH